MLLLRGPPPYPTIGCPSGLTIDQGGSGTPVPDGVEEGTVEMQVEVETGELIDELGVYRSGNETNLVEEPGHREHVRGEANFFQEGKNRGTVLGCPKGVQSGHPDNTVKTVGGARFGDRFGVADQTFGEGVRGFLPGPRHCRKDLFLGNWFLRGADLGRDKKRVDSHWVRENF